MCSQAEGKQVLVKDDLKIMGERITDGRCLKLMISFVGFCITSWGVGKKGIRRHS